MPSFLVWVVPGAGVGEAALNVAGQAQRKESEMQGLMQLHALAASSQKAGLAPDWAAIRRSLLRTKPPYAENLDAMISFLATRSGGAEGAFLQYLQAFYRNFVNPSVRSSLPGALYMQLATFPYHYLALAIWQAAYTCPKESLRGSVCAWISSGEVASLAKSASGEGRSRLESAEHFLARTRLLLPTAGLSPTLHFEDNVACAIFGKCDIAMARLVLSKQQGNRTQFASPAEVFGHFCGQLQEAFPQAKVEKLRAEVNTEASSSPAAASLAASSQAEGAILLYAVNQAGTLGDGRGVLRQRGIDVGSCIASAEGVPHRVVAVNAESGLVHLAPWDPARAAGSSLAAIAADVIAEDWHLCDPRALVEEHPAWPAARWHRNAAAVGLQAKGRILHALGCLAKLVEETHPLGGALSVLSKPSRRVLSQATYPKGSIVLVPESSALKVFQTTDDSARPDVGVEVFLLPEDGERQYFLMPNFSNEYAVPYWHVGSTPDDRAGNMEEQRFQVQVMTAADYAGTFPLVPMQRRRLRGKSLPDAGPDDEVDESYVVLTVLVNNRVVSKGEELLLHRAPAAKRPRAPEPITVAKLAKMSFGRKEGGAPAA